MLLQVQSISVLSKIQVVLIQDEKVGLIFQILISLLLFFHLFCAASLHYKPTTEFNKGLVSIVFKPVGLHFHTIWTLTVL